jgi:hypothetical protein
MSEHPVPRTRRVLAALSLAALLAALTALVPARVDAGGIGSVLVLEPMVSGGASSIEATYATSLGYSVDLVDATEWGALTTGDFDDYAAIIIGDPNCSSSGLEAPAANASTWAAAVTGNVIVIGTDPVLHSSTGQATQLIQQGIDFALADTSGTGAFITTSCIYHSQPAGTAVPALDGFGDFTAIGASNLPGLNDVHLAATHPAIAGLTDAGLSNWSNSVHNGFDSWPSGFEVLAIARDAGGNYTTPDGVLGYPYILARGVEVIRAVNLSPEAQDLAVGAECAIDVSVALDEVPQEGAEVVLEVTSGPQAGETATVTTDADGNAVFSYIGAAAGTDTIVGVWDNDGTPLESNEVTCTFAGDPVETTTTTTTTAPPGTPPPPAAPQPVAGNFTG